MATRPRAVRPVRSHDRCNHTPAERAHADQDAAGFRDGITAIVRLARKWLAEGDDDVHTAARIDVSLSTTAAPRQISALVGFAVLRIVELEDIAAAACPCLPGAPAHQHLTGGYRPDHKGGMSDAEFEDWQHERDVFDERTRDAADRGPETRP